MAHGPAPSLGLHRTQATTAKQVYAGLGAPKKIFEGHNDVRIGQGPMDPVAGTDEDIIERVSPSGRVLKYSSVFNGIRPPYSDREKILLMAGIDLPGYPDVVRETRTCWDWRSKTLARMTGKEYAQATTITGMPDATIEVVSHPSC